VLFGRGCLRRMALVGTAKRAFEVFLDCWDKGLLIRTTGDIIALSPPLIISKAQIDELVGTLGGVLREIGRD